MQHRTAIILLNWNSFEFTNDCLLSLRKTEGEGFDVIVVDNGSTDDSGAKLKETFPEIILLQQDSNLGFAEGNNKGFEYALQHGYEYAMMLNNDVFVHPIFLQHLINHMDLHPTIGAIQPKIYFNNDRTEIWNGGTTCAKRGVGSINCMKWIG